MLATLKSGSLGTEGISSHLALNSVVFEGANKLHQAAHRNAGRAFGDPALVLVDPGCAGDVEVNPRSFLGKLFEEDRRSAGASPAAAGVHDVGDAGADHVEIFGIKRQTPEFFS